MLIRRLYFSALPALLFASHAGAIDAPSQTPTIVVRGFDQSGASATGTFGIDEHNDSASELAATLGLPTSDISPYARNQVAYTNFYGTQYPPYYTAQDIADITSATTQYGGGVPRYALIIAKFSREVMRRSGAKQVNLFAPSFGALVSRWLIEKDVGGLASSGQIARWMPVEGVVCGNWVATQGGQSLSDLLKNTYDLDPIDLQHMNYSWIEANIHNPNDASTSPFLGQFETHIWAPSDDSLNNHALTLASQKPNDGVQLLRDEFFHSLAPASEYLGQFPTLSSIHATHESSKQHLGFRAGLAADLFGRRRVKIVLSDAYVLNNHESSGQGNGEFVFGVKVTSPRAQTAYGITDPIHELSAGDRNLSYFSFADHTTTTINLTWFDDMILPGEDHLVLSTQVKEIDYDLVYGISENIFNPDQSMTDTVLSVSALSAGSYAVSTADWRGTVTVTLTDYPAFAPEPTAASGWEKYY